jgi:uncharacterized membrane protein
MAIELIVATFEDDETKAGLALQRVQDLAREGALVLEQAATVVKTTEGEVKITDVHESEPKKGAFYGAITGGLLGLIGGPAGVIAGSAIGAAAGGGLAKVSDHGVSNKMIKEIKAGLQPGSSAIIVYAQLAWVDKAIANLEQEGATVTHTTLTLDYVDDLV